MKNEAPIKAYHDEIHAFLKRLKNLRKWDDDLSMLRDVQVRSADGSQRLGGNKEDGPSVHNSEAGGQKMADVVDFTNDNNQSPRAKDVIPKEGQVDETPEIPFTDQGEKGVDDTNFLDETLHTDGDKEVTPIQGQLEAQTPAPYLAPPPFKVQKMTPEQKKIVDFLISKPKADGPTSADETCIKIVGPKWPLNFNDVHRPFRPRGLVSKLVIHTVRNLIMMDELQHMEEGKSQPKRHIFYPDFAINLVKDNHLNFNTYMRDACDVNKVHYDLILPVLLGDGETGHWFCVAVNLVDLRVEVLDSMKSADLTDRWSTIETIWNNLFALLNDGEGVPRHTADEFQIVYPKVPQQDNGHDCGIYLIKFMELWKGRMVSAELESDNMNNIRRRILYSLFMDERNEQRDSVLAAINN
ncbi:hypothetical protein Vadar_012962 [Vaccinium darrowii]|uniref:Uncharacterized protein n=1 Tax=Vaccinium darrowii TaxID=229202 RepID=A0ACB7X9Y5_9ERIC|nr:hypothetical protein Vadar_012962 [Vaccinium darrowii]